HRLTITPKGHDPRVENVLQNARDLGLDGLRSVEIADIYFLSGSLNQADRDGIQWILVDPLLQTGSWDQYTNSKGDHVVESMFHPGVTDPVATELQRLAGTAGIEVVATTGKRFALIGEIERSDVDRLASSVLANPIIEQWSIDSFASPLQFPNPDGQRPLAEEIDLSLATTDEDLIALNVERGLALDIGELRAIRDYFDKNARSPTDVELETLAQTWSEHCAHKTFRAKISTDDGVERDSLIDTLRRSTDDIAAPFVVSAFVGNAGIISFTPGRTLAVKCETHNHPSAIEPFGGANTGIGGVIRDILGAAHSPIACTNILCFGSLSLSAAEVPAGVFHPRRVQAGVIDGIADYGNKIGLPTVAGAVLYDNGYTANPLVYAGCIGSASYPLGTTYVESNPNVGDRIIVLGGKTGRDGLRGATFSSMTMDATTGDVAGASVQIGDPITEKLLCDVLLLGRSTYTAITDCGAGGLSSAIGEMAQDLGAKVDLTNLPMKYPGLAPWEVWLSEAQERMVVAVKEVEALAALCDEHDVSYTDVGVFTGDKRLVVRCDGNIVLDLDIDFLHHGRPQRQLVAVMPKPNRSASPTFSAMLTNIDPLEHLLRLVAHPNISSKESVIHRYDHEIRGTTIVRPLVGAESDGHGDGVVLAEPTDQHGIAIGIGVNPWFGLVDPQRMAAAVVDEAIRNVVAVGADPTKVALLDNFSWGDPTRSTTLGELVAAVDGCVQAARAFNAPFVSGKDSLNNEFHGSDGERHAVPPTLVITAIAHVPDVALTVTSDLKLADNVLMLIGATKNEFGGSHLSMIYDALGTGAVP
ncbi:MAG: AIR synthase-related protein, partial [Ilumatobacteraceae bacterium]